MPVAQVEEIYVWRPLLEGNGPEHCLQSLNLNMLAAIGVKIKYHVGQIIIMYRYVVQVCCDLANRYLLMKRHNKGSPKVLHELEDRCWQKYLQRAMPAHGFACFQIELHLHFILNIIGRPM